MEKLIPEYKTPNRDGVYTFPELDFPADVANERPYIYFNMVSSADGHVVTQNGDAAGLGSETDHFLMGKLRLAADAIMIGAETFRRDPFVPSIRPNFAEERARYFPNAPQPWGIVLSSNGNLPLDKKFFTAGPKECRLVALGEKASADADQKFAPFAQVVRVPSDEDDRPDLRWLMHYLYTQLGVKRLLCEGGPSLNYAMLKAGLGDEFFMTLAPKLLGNQSSGIISGQPQGLPDGAMLPLELVSLYRDGSELFFRYRVVRDKS
jgi:2,5-diamino-6-(ribosylamino)-4(3H)-pyrimidinone 5'-phosphate reductase